MFVLQAYSYAFLFCVILYVVNSVNVGTYPAYLDGPRRGTASVRGVLCAMFTSLRESVAGRYDDCCWSPWGLKEATR